MREFKNSRETMATDEGTVPAIELHCSTQRSSWILAAPRTAEEEILIGRANECTILCQFGGVSRRHARIIREGGKLFVEDLKSANGTKVNSVRITEKKELVVGMRIDIADCLVVKICACG